MAENSRNIPNKAGHQPLAPAISSLAYSLNLADVERRLRALNSLRFCCATVAQNSRKFSGCGRGLKLC
jgi:hypothetical protein